MTSHALLSSARDSFPLLRSIRIFYRLGEPLNSRLAEAWSRREGWCNYLGEWLVQGCSGNREINEVIVGNCRRKFP